MGNKKLSRGLIIFLVLIVSISVRIYAANTIQIDFDEPVYLNTALEYTKYIREGKLSWLAWNTKNFEHPSLYKIVYGVALLGQDPIDKLFEKDIRRLAPIQESDGRPWILVGRYLSVFFSSIAIFVLALINPLAGFFLAVDTLSIKYTSVVYLEALPLLSSLIAALCYLKWIDGAAKAQKKYNNLWLFGSAAALGITAASKYVYCVVGLAILAHFLWMLVQKKINTRNIYVMLLWGVTALIAFFMFNPYLWPHPVERLVQSLTFHMKYPSSNSVKSYHYPFWQPLIWFSAPFSTFFPATRAAFLLRIDLFITIFALIGLPRLYKKQIFYFLWLVIGLVVLLFWPTKWPQYTLIILVPYCLSASQGVVEVVEKAKNLFLKRTSRNGEN